VKTRTEVSAGGVVFRERDAGRFEVALIRTHEGRWQLPKGWVEHGEGQEQAALREVREEAGIDAQVVGVLDKVEYWFKSTYDPEPARVHKFVHFFLLRYVSGSTDDHDDEVADARWVDIGEAQAMLSFKDERRIVAMAEQLLRNVAAEADAG
jgi:8-oxo-dGTP pyrophosphatase MutT (NUDIX family)